jgi:hypothetical protein
MLPQIHHSKRISTTFSCWTCYLLVGQHFTLYNIVGRIVVLYNLPFSISGTLGSHKTPEAWRYFNHLTLIL